MNVAVMVKTFRDSLALLVIVVVSIVMLETFFVAAMTEFAKELEYLWMQKPIFQRFARVILGGELNGDLSLTSFMTVGFAHPMLFGLVWAFTLTTCTRVTVSEIERGTADIMLTLPISRASLYSSISAVWILAGIPISVAVLVGAWLGAVIFQPNEALELDRLSRLIPNLFMTYVCVGCMTMMVSSTQTRRGPALAIILGWLIASLLFNFLGQFWSVAETLSALGPLKYYRPLIGVRTGGWQVQDMLVLLGASVVSWWVGLLLFGRRDIPAA